ncbi:prepilin peptidase [Candidatus Trichorickettsia mobilis]|uniref:prepilin peptidase n=1 Tax=Candidatus Trichorickettsia mobilis TaxID=1346319 RepID=UPI00292F8FDF|nr:prepilin peptidase [Candidatus Trichorickettsia mobilis]
MLEYIIVTIFGLLIGNFATTIFYRLPRNITICGINQNCDQPPFCSYCRHLLKPYEYLPLLSWFSTFGKCNYCNSNIPAQYFILEISAVILSNSCFYLFNGITDLYILIFGFGVSCLLNILIYREHKAIPQIIIISMLFWGAIYRTLTEQTIILWLSSLSIAFIISLFLLNNKFNNTLRSQCIINILMLTSVWCSQEDLTLYIIIIAILCILWSFWKQLDLYSLSILTLFCITISDAILFLNQT